MTMPAAGFWSGETLRERLKTLIDPFSADRVDCAAYTLAIGSEVYISPNDQNADPTKVTILKLSEQEAFTIPAGQFAFLISEEVVSVPSNALAFISIRAKSKFRGLVNVSGFHVDPGYRGQLTFAVFNAGPVSIHLKQGQAIFLIWYASLDRETVFKKDGRPQKGLNAELITGIAGELQSIAGVSKKLRDTEKSLGDRIHAIEKQQTYYRNIAVIVLPLILLMAGTVIKDWLSAKSVLAPTTQIPLSQLQAPSPQTQTPLPQLQVPVPQTQAPRAEPPKK
jgi:dCTP deaminase